MPAFRVMVVLASLGVACVLRAGVTPAQTPDKLDADHAAKMAKGLDIFKPRGWYEGNPQLKEVIDRIAAGDFSAGDRNLFQPLVDHLLSRDDYLLLADYQAYIDCQDRVSAAFRDRKKWTHMSILNVARMGKFSSDRAIREYCEQIWHAPRFGTD